MNYVRRSVLGQRVRFQLLDLSSRDRQLDESVVNDIDDLAYQQIEIWTRKKLDKTAVLDNFRHLNETYLSVYVLSIDDGRIKIADKPSIAIPSIEQLQYQRHSRTYLERIEFYRIFLERVIARSYLDLSMTIAVDVNDTELENVTVPLFTFQKIAGSSNILLPDVDFFWWNWYRRPRDTVAYEDKKIVAGFVGSSTGGTICVNTVKGGLNPRLRAAAHFVGSTTVDFRVTKAVQVDGAEAKSLLESQAYFSRTVSWCSQFRNRFLISMDGNGAACSRLAIGLKSQGAVIKYESPHLLFYYSKMAPGREYIAVSAEADIERVVETERASPGSYRAVADAGRHFFMRYLERDRVMDYTAALLQRYAELCASML
jgi:hypothetical protein